MHSCWVSTACDRWFMNVHERALARRSGASNANPEPCTFNYVLSNFQLVSYIYSPLFLKNYDIKN